MLMVTSYGVLNDMFWIVLLIAYMENVMIDIISIWKYRSQKNVARFVLRINPVPSSTSSVFVADSVADKKNNVLRINPVLGKGFMCFVARVARFFPFFYIIFLF